MWAFADQGSYKMTLRRTLKNIDKCRETAKELQEIVNERFSDEGLFEGFCDAIYKPEPEMEEWLSELEEMGDL